MNNPNRPGEDLGTIIILVTLVVAFFYLISQFTTPGESHVSQAASVQGPSTVRRTDR
jgi:hypothetical protein